jgi:hypothetical protein
MTTFVRNLTTPALPAVVAAVVATATAAAAAAVAAKINGYHQSQSP